MLKNYEKPEVLLRSFMAVDVITASVGKQNEEEGGVQGDFFTMD